MSLPLHRKKASNANGLVFHAAITRNQKRSKAQVIGTGTKAQDTTKDISILNGA